MFGYTEAPQAWARTSRMARHAGADLCCAVVDGWLERRELDAIVSRCSACTAQEDCGAWLVQAEPLAPPPGFCPNRTVLAALGVE